MAEVEYTTTAKLAIDDIWDFVKEMDNWAPFVAGYQTHEKQSETDSTWTLKGDVGVMSRILKMRVHITEWDGPERVTFELEGLNEPMTGGGSFEMCAYEEESSSPAPGSAAPRQGLFARLLAAIVGFFYRLFRGGRPQRGEGADAGPGEGMAKLTFRVRLQPGGPMAPMIDALIKPMLPTAAEDLANQIMATLERQSS